jgi:hypothetical protein
VVFVTNSVVFVTNSVVFWEAPVHGDQPLPNAYSRYKVEKKRRLCIFPKKRTKIDLCLQYPHVESITLMTENIESEKHCCDVD